MNQHIETTARSTWHAQFVLVPGTAQSDSIGELLNSARLQHSLGVNGAKARFILSTTLQFGMPEMAILGKPGECHINNKKVCIYINIRSGLPSERKALAQGLACVLVAIVHLIFFWTTCSGRSHTHTKSSTASFNCHNVASHTKTCQSKTGACTWFLKTQA